MGAAVLSVMDDDHRHQEALAAAGYTGLRGTLIFCSLLAIVGALLGSVVIAILWNMLTPGLSETLTTWAGAAAGAALFVLLGLFKIHRGNLEARELVEDKEWRRQLLRQHTDRQQ